MVGCSANCCDPLPPAIMKTPLPLQACLLASALAATSASAEIFGGIDFPGGAASFADEVLHYDCDFSGGVCPAPQWQDTVRALGVPDEAILSLGTGGLVEVLFADNRLTNSGDASDDLYIFERGADVEDTLVAVRPTPATAARLGSSFDANADGYYEIGNVAGGVASIDIDAVFGSFTAGVLIFDAVQLIDNDFELGTSQGTHGADIDAVGALASRLAGDANFDGTVDLADFGILRANFGQSNATFDTADFNDDGKVDLADFGILRANFGLNSASDIASIAAWYAAVVPEPTTATCAIALMGALLRRRA